jgi:hypothetical protein
LVAGSELFHDAGPEFCFYEISTLVWDGPSQTYYRIGNDVVRFDYNDGNGLANAIYDFPQSCGTTTTTSTTTTTTTIAPPPYSFMVSVSNTSGQDACAQSPSITVYSYVYSVLINGETYYDQYGNPFDGSTYSYWSDNAGSCTFGVIGNDGVYTSSGTCSPCA